MLGSREAYLIEAPRSGRPKHWYFDVETGLLLRTEGQDIRWNFVQSRRLRKHRVVDGIKIAFTTRQIDEDGTEIIIKLTEVKHNVPIDDAKFEKPSTKAPAPAKPSAVSQASRLGDNSLTARRTAVVTCR